MLVLDGGARQPEPPADPPRDVVADEPGSAGEPDLFSELAADRSADVPVAAPAESLDEEPYTWEHPFHFVCGPAGSGKTFLTRDRVRRSPAGSCVIMASTGIAAVNLGDAVTINSQLGYFDTADMEASFVNGYLQQRLRRLRQAGVERLVLDEVSMMEARQLTALVRAIDDVNKEASVLMGRFPAAAAGPGRLRLPLRGVAALPRRNPHRDPPAGRPRFHPGAACRPLGGHRRRPELLRQPPAPDSGCRLRRHHGAG
jgi:hypothetical protein